MLLRAPFFVNVGRYVYLRSCEDYLFTNRYVKSKHELFVFVLRERLEQTNQRFMQEIEQGRRTFADPMVHQKTFI